MYLTRLILNSRTRAVRRDLADCHEIHRTVMRGFPASSGVENAREVLGVLYRVDTHAASNQPMVLVQSLVAPEWANLDTGYLWEGDGGIENPACKQMDGHFDRLKAGQELLFRLKANPTKKIDARRWPEGTRPNGMRVELNGEASQLEWLKRKGEQHGFQLLSVRSSPDVLSVQAVPGAKVTGSKSITVGRTSEAERARLTFGSVVFDGVLRIADSARFRDALEKGIGAGKAYGFGLLSIAPQRG